jgi:ComF family protein
MQEHRDSCATCLTNPPVFSHCFSLFAYATPLDSLINNYKNHNQRVIGHWLGLLLARSYIRHHQYFPDLWLPVPLHKSTLRSRGFNQAEELAIDLGKLTHRPLLCDAVKRSNKTAVQKHLSQSQRHINMRNAFKTSVDFSGKKIAIVDDVVTTGATVTALAETLLAAGASDVEVVCVARTAPH